MRQQRRFSCLRVIGCLLVIVGLGAGSVILMTTPERRERTERTACRANLRQLSTAMLAYARENDDRLPPRAVWSRAIEPHVAVEQVFRCPTAPRGLRSLTG